MALFCFRVFTDDNQIQRLHYNYNNESLHKNGTIEFQA